MSTASLALVGRKRNNVALLQHTFDPSLDKFCIFDMCSPAEQIDINPTATDISVEEIVGGKQEENKTQ